MSLATENGGMFNFLCQLGCMHGSRNTTVSGHLTMDVLACEAKLSERLSVDTTIIYDHLQISKIFIT